MNYIDAINEETDYVVWPGIWQEDKNLLDVKAVKGKEKNPPVEEPLGIKLERIDKISKDPELSTRFSPLEEGIQFLIPCYADLPTLLVPRAVRFAPRGFALEDYQFDSVAESKDKLFREVIVETPNGLVWAIVDDTSSVRFSKPNVENMKFPLDMNSALLEYKKISGIVIAENGASVEVATVKGFNYVKGGVVNCEVLINSYITWTDRFGDFDYSRNVMLGAMIKDCYMVNCFSSSFELHTLFNDVDAVDSEFFGLGRVNQCRLLDTLVSFVMGNQQSFEVKNITAKNCSIYPRTSIRGTKDLYDRSQSCPMLEGLTIMSPADGAGLIDIKRLVDTGTFDVGTIRISFWRTTIGGAKPTRLDCAVTNRASGFKTNTFSISSDYSDDNYGVIEDVICSAGKDRLWKEPEESEGAAITSVEDSVVIHINDVLTRRFRILLELESSDRLLGS